MTYRIYDAGLHQLSLAWCFCGRRFADLRRDESKRGNCRQVAGGSPRLLLSEQVIYDAPHIRLAAVSAGVQCTS